MSIQIRRVLACDGAWCGVISVDVLRTTDADSPDWQGWLPVRDESSATAPEAIKHLCPACVAAGNVVESNA